MTPPSTSASAVFGVLRFLFARWRRHARYVVQIVDEVKI